MPSVFAFSMFFVLLVLGLLRTLNNIHIIFQNQEIYLYLKYPKRATASFAQRNMKKVFFKGLVEVRGFFRGLVLW